MGINERKFLEEKVAYLKNRAFDFQKECDSGLADKESVLLSMPTGSGKTDRYLVWAIERLLRNNIPGQKIIITAPIKALSNQRFRELYLQGYNVGIETGDVSFNVDNCTFLCCTQEIATFKYREHNNISIIDEFHYIFESSARARAYMDYVINSKSKSMFLCSATFGNVENLKEYLNKVTERNFVTINSDERITDITMKSEISIHDIKDAMVLSFDSKKCVKNANHIRDVRKRNKYEEFNDVERKKRILQTATKYDVNDIKLISCSLFGVSYFYGSMLPKERLFVAELFENKLIDVVCATDAISLGVNFPIENVVFTSLEKSGKVITKNLFEQLIGRSGRYGLFKEGKVYYSKDFQKEDNIEEEFANLISGTKENVQITMIPSIRDIINCKKTVREEIDFCVNNSTTPVDAQKYETKIHNSLELIRNFDIVESLAQEFFYGRHLPRKYKKIDWANLDLEKQRLFNRKYGNLNCHMTEFFEEIGECYFDEFSPEINCLLLRDVICGFSLEKILRDGTGTRDGKFKKRKFSLLLEVRKYLTRLPEKYKKYIDLAALDQLISDIDVSVFDVELSFQEYSDFIIYSSQELNKIMGSSNLPKDKFSVPDVPPKKEVKKVVKVEPVVAKPTLNKNKVKDDLTRRIESATRYNSENRPKKKPRAKNRKHVPNPENLSRPFEVGSIVKLGGSQFGSHKYLVLMYQGESCVLVNYSMLKSGFVSMELKPGSLSGYFVIDNLSSKEYRDALEMCKANSFGFFASEKSTEKDMAKIRKMLSKASF